jgi:hypothetical protein
MIKGADSTPKVYGNNANHPGHTTAAFNKQKQSYDVPYSKGDPNILSKSDRAAMAKAGSEAVAAEAKNPSPVKPEDAALSRAMPSSDKPNTDPDFLKDPLTNLYK